MKVKDGINEYGTPVTFFKCEYCGEEFSVCPSVPEYKLDNWKGCLVEWCESYDENRDIDKKLFGKNPNPNIKLINLGMVQ